MTTGTAATQTVTFQPYTYVPRIDPTVIEKALAVSDVSKMDATTRVQYYQALCASSGLSPLTRPFILLKTQNEELHWYATKDCAEQLRKIHRISTQILSRERTEEGLSIVTVRATDPTGRQEESQGIEFVGGLKGQALGNALMKASSKALRRVTLAICGLGIGLADDERGQVVPFDPQTGAVELPPVPEAGQLLTVVGQWFRQRPSASRETIAQGVWGVGLHEMPHLGYDELRAGWARLDEGRAPLDWQSATLAADLVQWLETHAAQAILDVFDRASGLPDDQTPMT